MVRVARRFPAPPIPLVPLTPVVARTPDTSPTSDTEPAPSTSFVMSVGLTTEDLMPPILPSPDFFAICLVRRLRHHSFQKPRERRFEAIFSDLDANRFEARPHLGDL